MGSPTYNIIDDFEYSKGFLYKSIDHRHDIQDYKFSDKVV